MSVEGTQTDEESNRNSKRKKHTNTLRMSSCMAGRRGKEEMGLNQKDEKRMEMCTG